MIDSETVVGTGLRITVSKDELAAEARDRRPRCLDAHGGARARRHPAARRGGQACISPPPTWRCRCARRSRRRSPVKAPWSFPAGCCSTSRARCPDSEVDDRAPPRGGRRRRVTAGTAKYRLHTYSAEDFPRLPEIDAATLHAVDRDALVETIARVGRSASRDESRPVLTGILVRFEPGKIVMAATDSYRLAVKETPVDGTLPELEAIIPARALQELARIAAGADERAARRAGEPRRVRRRRHLADDAPHRRPVPELPPAAAGAVRARAAAAARGGARGRPPRVADGAAQLAAAPALRRRRADGLARSRRTSARRASRCRRRSAATRSRSGSTRSSCATASSRWTRTR